MRRRADRYSVDVAVEVFAHGVERRCVLSDLSRTGAFLKLSPPLDVGDPVFVAMFFEGRQLAAPATVVHSLSEADARALGRPAGIGVAFDPPTRHADMLFLRAVDRMLSKRVKPSAPALHVVVGDPSTRILERLSAELGEAGCTVATAANGLEVIGACMRKAPDVVVVDRLLPVIDGIQMVNALGRRAGLGHVPVIVMAQDSAELAQAFERGAKDVLKKPFVSAELVARCQHVVHGATKPGERVVLRTDLQEVGLPQILVMLEQEKKSGRLVLRSGSHAGWVELSMGAIVDAGSTQVSGDLRGVVMSLLDWTRGELQLVAATNTDVTPTITSTLAITYALMEHARICDERDARKYMA
ncbi:MAG: response regulator [Kofleriaceae bacterium]